jgi:hypothetical protein
MESVNVFCIVYLYAFRCYFATGNGEVLLHIPNTEPIFLFTVNATVAVDGQG